jgi:hypothetical protein
MVDARCNGCIAPPAIAGAMKWVHFYPRRWCCKGDENPGASVAELELFGDGLVSDEVGGVEVIQKAAALADHFEEAAPGAVIFDVFLQMFGQVVDPFGQKSHLHISGPRVALMNLEPYNRLAFFHSRSVKIILFEREV